MRSTNRFCLVFVWSLLLVSGVTVMAAPDDQPPGWMRQAASATIPAYEKDVPAVVLHDEQQVTLSGDGKLVTVENYAIKLLTRQGRNYAVARAFYLVSAGKVKDINGWLIRVGALTKGSGASSAHSGNAR